MEIKVLQLLHLFFQTHVITHVFQLLIYQFYGLFDLIQKGYFKRKSTILAIHTGGLQGNLGMNERFNLNLPL